MTNRIRFDAALNDKVSTALDRIKSKADALGGKGTAASLFGNIGAKAAAVGFGLVQQAASQVVDVLGQAVQAAIEEEQSVSRLDAALKANVRSYTGNRDAIEKTMAARMRLGFADDEQRSSLALLVVAHKDETKALEAQRAAMDLARLKGISLAEASTALVKIEGGQFRALKSLGIVLKEGATATDALAAVQKAAAGQAEAYANTLGGKMLASQIRVGEAMEKVGARILPIVAEAMSSTASAIESLVGFVESAIGAFDAFGEGLSALSPPGGAEFGQSWQRWREETPWPLGQKDAPDWAYLGGQVSDGVGGLVKGVGSRTAGMGKVAAEFADKLPTAITLAGDKALTALQIRTNRLIALLEDRRSAVQDAANGVANATWDPQIRRAELALVNLALKDKDLLSRLQSTKASVRAEAEIEYANLRKDQTRLQTAIRVDRAQSDTELRASLTQRNQATAAYNATLLSDSGRFAKATAQEHAEQFERNRGRTQTAARNNMNEARDEMAALAERARIWGERAARYFAQGLASQTDAVRRAAEGLAEAAGNYIRILSPAKMGPLSGVGPEGFGRNLGLGLASGMGSTTGAVARMAERLASAAVPNAAFALAGPGLRHVGGSGVSAGSPVEFPIVLDGREIARVISPHLYYLQQSQPSRG